jgi:hypothetical protein
MGWQRLSVPHFGVEQRTEPVPIRMCSTHQVFTSLGDRLFEILDAVKNGFFLGVYSHLVTLLD